MEGKIDYKCLRGRMPTSNWAFDNDCLIQPCPFSVAICEQFGTKRDDNKNIGLGNFAGAWWRGAIGIEMQHTWDQLMAVQGLADHRAEYIFTTQVINGTEGLIDSFVCMLCL